MKIQRPDMKLLRSHLLWLVCAAGAQLALLAFALETWLSAGARARRRAGSPGNPVIFHGCAEIVE
jgi:hypothetical protein